MNKHQFPNLIPCEVAGWWCRRCGMQSGDWLLVGTPDREAVLAAHMLARGPLGAAAINVVCGISGISGSGADLDEIHRRVQEVVGPRLVEADGLGDIVWEQCGPFSEAGIPMVDRHGHRFL